MRIATSGTSRTRSTPGRGAIGALLVATLLCAVPATAFAQDEEPGREGFTLLASLGVGIQNDPSRDRWAGGLAGLNMGAGLFLTDRVAVLARLSSATVSQATGQQSSGVLGATGQLWIGERLHVEGGPGVGFWRVAGGDDKSPGLILGAGYALYRTAGHSMNVGVEYALALTDPDPIHSFGILFRWQLL